MTQAAGRERPLSPTVGRPEVILGGVAHAQSRVSGRVVTVTAAQDAAKLQSTRDGKMFESHRLRQRSGNGAAVFDPLAVDESVRTHGYRVCSSLCSPGELGESLKIAASKPFHKAGR